MSEIQSISSQQNARIEGNVQLAVNALKSGQLASSVMQKKTIKLLINKIIKPLK